MKEKLKPYKKYYYEIDTSLTEKTCSACKQTKSIENFSVDHKYKGGYFYYCKDCRNGRLKRRYFSAKSGAKTRHINFNISLEDFDKITSKKCYYCGEYSDYYYGKGYVGIDRINNNFGYIQNNIVPCCELCNKFKGSFSIDQFKNRVIKIYNRFGDEFK